MGIPQGVKLFRGLYEWLPRTLRTPLNSPYTPYSPNTPNNSNELNTSNLSGFPISLKKLILTAYAMRGEVNESGYMSRTLGIIGMDRMDRKGRMGRIAQGVI